MSTSVQGETMDLDLNQEPSSSSSDSESPTGLITELSPWLNDLETAQERIEERISQLEAIVSRIRERESTTTTPALAPPQEHRDSTAGVIHERSRERLVENGDDNKKTYLIAKALNMEKTTSSVPVGYFDCNICLEKARDPILTCCGHLFCWGCFYQLPLIYLNIKECPVCDGEVTDTEVVPIYGNGDGDSSDGTKPKMEDCGIRLPPRPNAKRVESVRQKIINRAIPFIPVHETIEHIRRTIDSIGLQAIAQGDEFGLSNIITNNGGDNGGGGQQHHHHHHHHPPFGPLRLLPPHMPPFASFPGLVVDTSEMQPPSFDNDDDGDDEAFDVDSFVDTTTSLRRNRRRSSRIADIGPSPSVRASSYQRNRSNNNASQTISFAVPGSSSIGTRSQTVNPTEVVTSVSSAASSSRRRAEDVNNGPRTRSRRRLL